MSNRINNKLLKEARRGLVGKLLRGQSKLSLSQLKLRKNTNIPLSMGLETTKFMNGIHANKSCWKLPQISEPDTEPLFEPEVFNVLYKAKSATRRTGLRRSFHRRQKPTHQTYSGSDFAQAQQTQVTASTAPTSNLVPNNHPDSNNQESFCESKSRKAKGFNKIKLYNSRGIGAKQLIPKKLDIFYKEKKNLTQECGIKTVIRYGRQKKMRGIHIKGAKKTKKAELFDKLKEISNYSITKNYTFRNCNKFKIFNAQGPTVKIRELREKAKRSGNVDSSSPILLNAETILRAQEQSSSKFEHMDINSYYSSTTWGIVADFCFYSGLWTPYETLMHINVKELLTPSHLEPDSTSNQKDCNMVPGPTGTVYLTTTFSKITTNQIQFCTTARFKMKKSKNFTESISAAQIVNYLAKIYSTDKLKPSTIKAYKSAILGLVKNPTEISNQRIFTEFFKALNKISIIPFIKPSIKISPILITFSN
ncbi:hypothetical protein BB561_000650 [Smittium simulii]|uniref:Uncharacterized protein n=1 Tax=Smittium simulii TaxID=133385 RepID=A0A2T9YYA5_9FUNG|nr:hypothetical protein BB561_000650 [Smittium simulii]